MEPAKASDSAKADTKRTPDGLPVHSFTTLLSDLGTLTLNHVSLPGRSDSRFLRWPRSRPNCRRRRSRCSAWTRIAMLT
ncbi:MAG: hypothetical protein OXC26_23110 [Albidovulum sp.]|nr:hypothetical protein [Albidovulum sp.]